MNEVDDYCKSLLEESKRFFEKAAIESDADGKTAYLHAAILLAFAGLEANLNAIADDFSERKDLPLLTQSVFFEKNIELVKGKFELSDKLKIYKLEDRIMFLMNSFRKRKFHYDTQWWITLREGIKYRNRLTHPKQVVKISEKKAREYIEAIIKVLDVIYKSVYNQQYPLAKSGIYSNLDF